jgi:alpha-1,6-mannosyltransferase
VLDAWPGVERRTGARLLLVGSGPARARLQRHPYAERAAWIPFERNRDRLADLLAAADLYVAPCSIEPFGLSALEALACGTPILSADRGGVSETVTRSGAGGVFPSGDSDALAEAAVSLISSDLSALGGLGRRYAEEHHGWDRVLDRLFDVYRGILRV